MVVFAIHSHDSAMGVHVFPILTLPPHPTPQGHPGAPALSSLSRASNLDWRPVFNNQFSPPRDSVHHLKDAKIHGQISKFFSDNSSELTGKMQSSDSRLP